MVRLGNFKPLSQLKFQLKQREGLMKQSGAEITKLVKVTTRGRISIPVEIRRQLGIQRGTVLQMKAKGERIEITRLPRLEGRLLLRSFSKREIEFFLDEDHIKVGFADRVRAVMHGSRMVRLNFRLFLDASVLLAAAISREGGTRLLLEACQAGAAAVFTNRLVLQEVREALQQHAEEALNRHRAQIEALNPERVPLSIPRIKALEVSREDIEPENAHIIAAAEMGRTTHLISLDRERFLRAEYDRALFPILVQSPEEFLQQYLPIEDVDLEGDGVGVDFMENDVSRAVEPVGPGRADSRHKEKVDKILKR
jgi:AbrB family looped-hinge helix DNA binding protein